MAKKKTDNNCVLDVKKNILTITVDLDEEVREAESGKSTIIGETRFEDLDGDYEGYKVNVMVIKMKEKKDRKKKE